MTRTRTKPPATEEYILDSVNRHCASCGATMWFTYENQRRVALLDGRVAGLRLRIRRCRNSACERFRKPCRPEEEGHWALPGHEFGLDVIAEIGALRYRAHRSVPEIHKLLVQREVAISERTVTNLLQRYDELLAVSLTDDRRLRRVLRDAGQVLLAIDGMQPDVGHEVLWVLRDCLSSEVLLARTLLSSSAADVSGLLQEVAAGLPVPVTGVVSDGQLSLRKAVAAVWPDVPHQLCHFHYLRQAAGLVYEADRHAKKELKKRVRGVRPLERSVAGGRDATARVVLGYCAAVRSALTDDGRPPLAASGLKLHARLNAIQESLERASKKGRSRQH